ncbi:hypothetical protein ACOMHN_037877 [Nucella lapillus]
MKRPSRRPKAKKGLWGGEGWWGGVEKTLERDTRKRGRGIKLGPARDVLRRHVTACLPHSNASKSSQREVIWRLVLMKSPWVEPRQL